MIRRHLKAVALTAGALAVVGAGAGAVAATGGGGDPAADLAGAINKQAGTTISSDQVQAAFKDLMKQRLDAEVAAGRLTQAQADEILKNAPTMGMRPFGGPGPGMHGGGPRAVMAPVAKLLKLTDAELRAKLQAGATLTKVASQQGVSKADLVAEIKKALAAGRPAGAPALSAAELQKRATDIADGKGPRGMHRFGGGHRGFGPGPGGDGMLDAG